ncbi:interleukin-1 receptor-associated kinase 3 [Astyanax mexicanus]|uniref:non-specific serine/threonine protein kinase n=1 Tax=Astyanax mexicanus TaxID=7994 RepID=A0A8B9GXC0_ASTMX|nr:interleukin-1 receptor-associated kinase 3 [Astyanax mexicanus]
MSSRLDPSTYLFDLNPLLMDRFCKMMDSGPDSLGWRGLAARILPSLLEVRHTEMHAAAGRSPTHEMVWSWAQQNKTVGDLIRVLEEMGHYRALNLFQDTSIPFSTSLEYSKPHSEDPSPPSDPDPANTFARNQRACITFAEVVEGTRNFHGDLKIGESTFSEVYRGRWGNESFAVKVFKQGNKGSWKTLWEKFKTEIEVLRLYQHPNILELWGSFSEGERYCLVYPFLRNGSLYHRLHHEETERPLSWKERLDIIKGTAKGVHCLHTAQPCMVICGNIKSSNILLDEHLQPKLSDFGMARLRPHSVNQSCTITMNTTSHGNLGYLPEEYIRDGKLSVKLDIYSIGMVILETCTGQKVIQEEPKHILLRDKLSLEAEEKGSVDACLRFMDSRAGQWPAATALCLLRLGLECTSSRARARPSMETVLQKLSQLLPPPFPPEDQPRTLDDTNPPSLNFSSKGLRSSLPMEDDEIDSPLGKPQLPEQSGPCECSQSEVTYLGSGEQSMCPTDTSLMDSKREDAAVPVWLVQTEGKAELDLYGSCPVECSCAAGAEAQGCEDCWANGFSHTPSFSQVDEVQSCQNTVENPAKKRLKDKIQLYNRGIIKTEELLSITSD